MVLLAAPLAIFPDFIGQLIHVDDAEPEFFKQRYGVGQHEDAFAFRQCGLRYALVDQRGADALPVIFGKHGQRPDFHQASGTEAEAAGGGHASILCRHQKIPDVGAHVLPGPEQHLFHFSVDVDQMQNGIGIF